MLAHDVLADQVVVGRPPVAVGVGAVSEADGREVVGERVEPHVGDVLRVPRERNAPFERGAADREVAQAALDQPDRLVAAMFGCERLGVSCVPVEEAVLETREAEEVVLLLEVLDGALVDRAAVGGAVDGDQFVVGVVLLAGHAVLAGEGVELDVAGVVAALQQLGDGGLVARFGGADEVVVADVESFPGRRELRSDVVGEGLRRDSGSFGCLLDLEAVLVGAGDVLDVVAEEAVPAGECVTDDRGVRVAEVRLGVHVVDRCRQVEPAHVEHARAWIDPGHRSISVALVLGAAMQSTER